MYYLIYICCYLISLLPFWILYGIADFCYVVIYYIVRYRRQVVRENLKLSFPEKSEEEIIAIEKKYYRNLSDMVVETIKMMTISKKQLQKRMQVDTSLFGKLYQQGKSCQVHLGHSFNWEWANLRCKADVPNPFIVVYKPISNTTFEKLMMKMRARFGTILVSTSDIQSGMQPWQNKNYVSVLVADQNPSNTRRSYWAPFLHRITAFYKGPELSARRGDVPVVFWDIRKKKRGYYQAELKLIFDHPKVESEGVITERFVRFLENSIREQPELWVWSHRRWKHIYPGGS
jgi:Kdo2-lipid IVA lauroyltransferase/acyltransferase